MGILETRKFDVEFFCQMSTRKTFIENLFRQFVTECDPMKLEKLSTSKENIEQRTASFSGSNILYYSLIPMS